MRIIHNLTFHVSDARHRELLALGVDTSIGLQTIVISEDVPAWPAIRRIADEESAVDIIRTSFDSQEARLARWSVLQADWLNGFPLPDDDFGYLHTTYDGTRCPECGSGGAQPRPFRIKKRPTWGRRSAFQLHWVRDEIFVHPVLWKPVLSRFNIRTRPVEDAQGRAFESVAQLVVDETMSLKCDDLRHEVCSACNEKKFLPVVRGRFPEPEAAAGHVFRSVERFGSGGEAFNLLLVSQEMASALLDLALHGLRLSPCGEMSRPAQTQG